MPGMIVHAVDIDTDALAAKLHRLADGIEDGSVLVDELNGSTGVGDGDDVTGTLEMAFAADQEQRELLDMVDAEVLGESDEPEDGEEASHGRVDRCVNGH